MTIKQVIGGWRVDIQPGGRGGKRVRKTFATKAEALGWERHVQAKTQEIPDWTPPKKDARVLSDLVDLWFKHHGAGLKDGEGRRRILLALCNALGNPRADLFTANQFAEYRMQRIKAGIKQNTMNREHAYLRAVFNENIRLQNWKKANPLENLRSFKIDESELAYLTLDQITVLLDEVKKSSNASVYLLAKTCLSSGGRWGEVEELRISQVRNRQIQFVQTKSSKARFIPISEELERELIEHHKLHGAEDRIFISAYSAFRTAIVRVNLKLADGQLTHILRHTFASHFMMNGGNILSLQKLLGHHSLAMTIRYAHLSPEHLQEARLLNPIAKLKAVDTSLTQA